MMKIFCILFALTHLCQAYGFWGTSTISGNTGTFGSYRSSHSCHAVGQGKAYVAFVYRTGVKDSLYYHTKNVYATPPSGPILVSNPIRVDTQDLISSVSIHHVASENETHLVYSVKIPARLLFPARTQIRHAIVKPGQPIAIRVVTSINSNIFEDEDDHLHPSFVMTWSDGMFRPAISYHRPNMSGGSLYYASLNDTGQWTSELVESGAHLTSRTALVMREYDQPIIVYEDSIGKRLRLAKRSAEGGWNKTTITTAPMLGRAHSPSACLTDSGTLWVAFIQHDGNQFNGVKRSLKLAASRPDVPGFIIQEIDSLRWQQGLGGSLQYPQIACTPDEDWVAISYTREEPVENQIREPLIAGSFQGGDFIINSLPNLPGIEPGSANFTSLALDSYGYPIITWMKTGGSAVRINYSQDWTDYDNDGYFCIQEFAFQKNWMSPDETLYQKVYSTRTADGSWKLHLRMNTPRHGSILENKSFGSALFHYLPQVSWDLKTWQNPPSSLKVFVSENPKPGEIQTGLPTAEVQLTIPPGEGQQYLRISVQRRGMKSTSIQPSF